MAPIRGAPMLMSMNTKKPLAVLSVALVFTALSARTQEELSVTIRATCLQTNAAGKFVTTRINNQTLLMEAALAGGRTDTKGLALVYHFQGSSFGDTIDVVNVTNGIAYKTLYGFFFGDSAPLGRIALTNGPGTEVHRIDYIYTDQNSHSLGASLTTQRFPAGQGGTTRPSITGQMEWLVTPDGTNATKLCTGTFMTGKVLF